MTNNLAKKGGTKIKLPECCEEIAQRIDNPAESGFDRFVGLEHLETGETSIRCWGSTEDVTSSMKLFEAGDVIVARRNVYLRRAARAGFDGVCSGDGIVLRGNSKVCLPELLPYLLNTDDFWGYVISQSDGTMSKRITVERLMAYEFDMPPIEEQVRWVEALIAVDVARDELERVVQCSESLTVPILRSLVGISDASVEGALIEGRGNKTPNETPLLSVREIGSKTRQAVQVGPFGGSVSSKYFAETGVPVAKINNITPFGTLDLSELVYLEVSHGKSLEDRYSIHSGDLLTAAQGATIGKSALADERLSGAIISQHLIRVSCDRDRCLPEWLHSWFMSPFVLRQIFASIQGGTRGGLNTNDVEEIVVPVPEMEDQVAYVSTLKSLRSTAEQARQRIQVLAGLRARLLSIGSQ